MCLLRYHLVLPVPMAKLQHPQSCIIAVSSQKFFLHSLCLHTPLYKSSEPFTLPQSNLVTPEPRHEAMPDENDPPEGNDPSSTGGQGGKPVDRLLSMVHKSIRIRSFIASQRLV